MSKLSLLYSQQAKLLERLSLSKENFKMLENLTTRCNNHKSSVVTKATTEFSLAVSLEVVLVAFRGKWRVSHGSA